MTHALPRQLGLGLTNRAHGGARSGSGPKPKGDRAGVSHHGRPEVTRRTPVHVSVRVRPHVWNLRSGRSFAVIERALAGARTWREFRVVHFSVQGDHLHLIVEADGNRALSEGMQGLSVRLAKGLNRLMGTRGKVFSDRFHAHVLANPSEVRNALAHVLLNRRSHMSRIGAPAPTALDRFSSAPTFDGWEGGPAPLPPRVTSPAATWLLRAGWRRGGLLSPRELSASSPGPRRSSRP